MICYTPKRTYAYSVENEPNEPRIFRDSRLLGQKRNFSGHIFLSASRRMEIQISTKEEAMVHQIPPIRIYEMRYVRHSGIVAIDHIRFEETLLVSSSRSASAAFETTRVGKRSVNQLPTGQVEGYVGYKMHKNSRTSLLAYSLRSSNTTHLLTAGCYSICKK